MQRHKMNGSHSRRLFSHTAGARHVHPKNSRPNPMRGGIRL